MTIAPDPLVWCRACDGSGDFDDGTGDYYTCGVCAGAGEHRADLAYGVAGGDRVVCYEPPTAELLLPLRPPLDPPARPQRARRHTPAARTSSTTCRPPPSPPSATLCCLAAVAGVLAFLALTYRAGEWLHLLSIGALR